MTAARCAVLALGLLAAGARASEPPAAERCPEPRPELCTQDYRPVCATRDTGIRCVTTPCDSTGEVEYPNACTACADPQVDAWREGPCPAALHRRAD